MRALIQWSIRNTPAMNTLLAGVLIVGAFCLYWLHREVFPAFDLEIVQVTVPYPGASPEEVEEGVCQKIEEAVQSIDGIKKTYAVAQEGSGSVILELESSVTNVQKVLNEIRSEVDRIPSFPELAEDPEIKQITIRREAIQVGVIGPDNDSPDDEVALRNLAERVREKLLILPSVSQAELIGTREYQIDIEIPEKTLRKFGLTLQDVANVVRRENLELPGGTMKTDQQEILLRGKGRREIGHEIAEIPLVTDPNGVVLTVGDLGHVRDEFADVTALHRINKKPGFAIKVEKTAKEDLMAIASEVHHFVDHANAGIGMKLPDGYYLTCWSDQSIVVQDRLDMLVKNGVQGLVLVFLILAAFLEIRLAFWVALGIPIAIYGAAAFMALTGQTLNMISMFSFMMALGIVVDDAIVIGENIYAHRQMGKRFIVAAVDGTVEVIPSVLASVTTTIIAFMPLLFVPGIMGKFIAVMPVVVIAMLIISVLESIFVLPCHLAHGHTDRSRNGLDQGTSPISRAWRFTRRFPFLFRWTFGAVWIITVAVFWFFLYPLVRISHAFNEISNRLLRWVIDYAYLATLRFSLHYPGIVLASGVSFLLISTGLILGGIVPFNVFPKLDANNIHATIEYPDGTAASVTDEATRILEDAIWELNDEYSSPDSPLVLLTHRMVGQTAATDFFTSIGETSGSSHLGSVCVELAEAEQRRMNSEEIVALWREVVQQGFKRRGSAQRHYVTAGYESLVFATVDIGPGGAPIEFRLLAQPERMADLEAAIEECKQKLSQYRGVFDITDNSRPGKWEFQLAIKDDAKAMGVPLADLAGTVRAAYYGEEVMRLQRGRHEVKLMVRYPPHERRNLANFDQIQIRTGGGAERPLTELALINVERGFSKINRLDQFRAITLEADVEESEGNAQRIVHDLKENFLPKLLAKYPDIHVRWEGQQEQWTESTEGLYKGLAIALVCMFALLTLEFRSYMQPLLILSVIPFGMIGAVAGHWLLHIPISLFSLFGIVALTGVVVNDSIVLIDFMNTRVRAGAARIDGIIDAAQRRFRPVMLTSLTTIGALLP
ncbi:MAG: efflux RND transporter permease subunit, partial [Pirellulales bacterium]|nr:efflux RND transporter permease subunit [Pirellulales bacterium]